jgi:hypothetical protein
MDDDLLCLICDMRKEDPVSLYCDRCWGKIFDRIKEAV